MASHWEEGLVLVLFVRVFDFRLFGFVCFLFLVVSGKGCGFWLLYSLDFSLTVAFVLSLIVFSSPLRLLPREGFGKWLWLFHLVSSIIVWCFSDEVKDLYLDRTHVCALQPHQNSTMVHASKTSPYYYFCLSFKGGCNVNSYFC